MKFIADLHLHSRYSRATSPEMCPEALCKWAQIKGIGVIGTGDFTHPGWLKELKQKLEPEAEGLFVLKKKYQPTDVPASCQSDVRFMLQAEVSSIYKKNNRVRKVHSVLLVPGFEAAEKINQRLIGLGCNLASDGRPIVGLEAKQLLEISLEASPEALLVPAHAWTPHFSVFGANSGFDSLQECFEELTPHIHAIETGLSSDPPMNRLLSALDGVTLLSNSDAHSPSKTGREANLFDTDVTYMAMARAIKTGEGFNGTLEFFPEEGKYHMDGHRACGLMMTPKETKKHGYLCPKCGRKVTVGVLHRVEALADRDEPKGGGLDFKYIVPLAEIVVETLGRGVNTKGVQAEYFKVIEALGNEFGILLDAPLSDLKTAGSERLSEAVGKMRSGDICLSPGYDGEFGTVKIFDEPKGLKKKKPTAPTRKNNPKKNNPKTKRSKKGQAPLF